MKNRSLFLLIFVSLLLAACAPQVTVTSEVTVTLPPPTDTPTPTPTPVAVDGVATIDGVLYVFDEAVQEWVVLPELDGEFERVVVTEDGRVVALDAGDTELYELSAAGEWMMAVPEQWREFAQSLPEGARMDAEAGRVYDNLNNVLYVLDAETNEWREPISLEYSANFPAVWHERFEGNVEGYDFSVPITLGLTEDAMKHPTHGFREMGMTQKGADAAAWLVMHSFWWRYRDMMGNPDVTFAEYMELVKEGKGQVEMVTLGENGIAKRTVLLDPRQGVSLVYTYKASMTIMLAHEKGFSVSADETGRLLVTTNRFRDFVTIKEYNRANFGVYLETLYVRDGLEDIAIALGAAGNGCLTSGSCGVLSLPDDAIEGRSKIVAGIQEHREGKSTDLLFWVK